MTEATRPLSLLLRVTGMILGPLQDELRAQGFGVQRMTARATTEQIQWRIPGTILQVDRPCQTVQHLAEQLHRAIGQAQCHLMPSEGASDVFLDPTVGTIMGALPNGREVDLMTRSRTDLVALMPDLLAGSAERCASNDPAVDHEASSPEYESSTSSD